MTQKQLKKLFLKKETTKGTAIIPEIWITENKSILNRVFQYIKNLISKND